jgi:hypothetical protein
MGDSDVETFVDSGDFDNALLRQFDNDPGGGFVELGDNVDDETESVAGVDIWGDSQENPFLVGPARTAYDYTGGSVERPAPAAELRERIDGETHYSLRPEAREAIENIPVLIEKFDEPWCDLLEPDTRIESVDLYPAPE